MPLRQAPSVQSHHIRQELLKNMEELREKSMSPTRSALQESQVYQSFTAKMGNVSMASHYSKDPRGQETSKSPLREVDDENDDMD